MLLEIEYLLRKKYPYSEIFWSVFSRFRTEYREILCRISPYSVRMWGNMDQKNYEYGHFLRSACCFYFSREYNIDTKSTIRQYFNFLDQSDHMYTSDDLWQSSD